MLGLLTRWAAIPLLITMLVAVFMIHIDDPFGKMEKGLMFGSFFLALFFTGAGQFSIDALIGKSFNKAES